MDTQQTVDRPDQTLRGHIRQTHAEPRNENRERRLGPVITLAYDNGPVDGKPSRREMAKSPVIALVLGVFFIAESFGPFLIGIALLSSPIAPAFSGAFRSVEEGAAQTLILLQLVIGTNLVLFATGTEKGFFRLPIPPQPLFSVIVFAQIATTLLCGAGWLVEAIAWQVIACVWVYNLLWIIVLRTLWMAGERLADSLRERQRGEVRKVQLVSVATFRSERAAASAHPYLIHTTRGTQDRPG